VGCWGVDPLDNDTAAVWLVHFEATPTERRHGMIRAALAPAVVGSDVYLDGDFACEALAAAWVLANDDPLRLDADLSDLAVTALDRIGSDNSEWRSLWQEEGEPRQILEAYDRHHGLTGQGFQAAVLDVWCEATKPYAARHSDRAYQAIRGREHLGIVANMGSARR
jgi:Domain of unknown function (DUF4259)